MFWMADVPFEPGASPFRCKGVLYIDTLAYFDEHIQGGRRALFGYMEDRKLQSFLAAHFVVGGWYDIFPLIALQSVAASFARLPYLEIVREVARSQLPRQFRGVHRYLLKLTSPEMVMMNLPRLGEKYYDFLRIAVRELGPKKYESTACGVPAGVASAYMISSDVAIRAALDLAGASAVRVHWFPLEPDGQAHGVPLMRTRRETTWM